MTVNNLFKEENALGLIPATLLVAITLNLFWNLYLRWWPPNIAPREIRAKAPVSQLGPVSVEVTSPLNTVFLLLPSLYSSSVSGSLNPTYNSRLSSSTVSFKKCSYNYCLMISHYLQDKNPSFLIRCTRSFMIRPQLSCQLNPSPLLPLTPSTLIFQP